ncbi:Dienelactone hydrolase family protein [Aquisphaera giovannonii]|uniref:Dienelactone hydrolase family protein n=1 Tax=Aquisphaera giovannonii TaxID=406548 RepID=A0A5B9VWB6_9BACT|nr:dienelactone hydrolase family protein [Aquisphaera giovannonii]QEH32379.1 Dienelactone hydrolase family protein [Aquisphaera giovannonii]
MALSSESFEYPAGQSHPIRIAKAPRDGKKYPVVVLVHGTSGLAGDCGKQLEGFAESIGALGYLTALPCMYSDSVPHLYDADITHKVPVLEAAIEHIKQKHASNADVDRLALVGFCLGSGIAMAYIQKSPMGRVKAFADFYGYVNPLLGAGVAKLPPTIMFHNTNDKRFVDPAMNSRLLEKALVEHDRAVEAHNRSGSGAKLKPIDHDYREYTETNPDPQAANHIFTPGGPADVESRRLTLEWLQKYMPPVGKSLERVSVA